MTNMVAHPDNRYFDQCVLTRLPPQLASRGDELLPDRWQPRRIAEGHVPARRAALPRAVVRSFLFLGLFLLW